MNKRENAIWKLIAFLGLLILVLNIFSVINSNRGLIQSIFGVECDAESKDCKEMRGITDYFNEFTKYPGSLNKKDKTMIAIIESYDIDSNEILRKSEKTGINKKTKMAELGFMEIYSTGSKNRRESGIYGFSLNNDKVTGDGEHFLTEIKGVPGKKCKKKLRLKNVIFKNDGNEINSDIDFIFSNQRLECADGTEINEGNSLYLTDEGEVWYSSTANIYSFEFKVKDSKILNVLEGSDPNIFDNFIILNTEQSIIGFSKTNFSIPKGCGMLFKLDLNKKSSGLNDITVSDNKRFYDLNILSKYDNFNDSTVNYVNYFYSKLNSENNVEVYMKTDNDVDEYSFDISCFECEVKDNVKVRSELEILRAKSKERDFYFSINTNDPLDLTNVVMFDGQDGYNQGKRLRAVVPTAIMDDLSGKGKIKGLVDFQNKAHTVTIGDTIGNFEIIDMNQKYFLGLNVKSNSLDTLKYKNGK